MRVFDLPNVGDRHRGRSYYYLKAGFESKAEPAIFRGRYLEDAESLGGSPMSQAAMDRVVTFGPEA